MSKNVSVPLSSPLLPPRNALPLLYAMCYVLCAMCYVLCLCYLLFNTHYNHSTTTLLGRRRYKAALIIEPLIVDLSDAISGGIGIH